MQAEQGENRITQGQEESHPERKRLPRSRRQMTREWGGIAERVVSGLGEMVFMPGPVLT